MSKKPKRLHRGDRVDAVRVRDLDGLHLIIPGMLPNRTDNEAFIRELIDTTAIDAYVAKKNAENPQYKYTMFHVILAAFGRAIAMRPRMNRFIMGGKFYDRNDITFSMIAKKAFSDNGAEGIAILKYDPQSEKGSIDEMHDKLCAFTYELRSHDKTDSTTDTINIITKLPAWLTYFFMRFLNWLDSFGRMPWGLAKDDPYNSTVFISNLGSIKLNAGYHHLANWGSNSIFVIVGEKKMFPFYDKDGVETVRPALEIGLTIDERIADGYYYSRTVKLVKELLAHPELLDTPCKEELQIEF